MFRKTVLALAAVAALGATATTASAGGKKFHGHFGFKHHSHGFKHHGFKNYGCHRYIAGYRSVWTYYGWVKKPIYKCSYRYGYGY